jgi:hypothetical protein
MIHFVLGLVGFVLVTFLLTDLIDKILLVGRKSF